MDWLEYQAFHRWVGLLMERHVQREISGNPLGMTWSVDPLAKVSDDALFEALVARHEARLQTKRNKRKPDPARVAAGTSAWLEVWGLDASE